MEGRRAAVQTQIADTDHSIQLFQPPATILTISSRSPALSVRRENSDGATASPLCSTTTLRGRSFCATRNSSIEHGSFASIGFPLAMTVLNSSFQHRTSNTRTLEHRIFSRRPLDVRCSVFNVRCFHFTPSTPRPNPSRPVRSRACGSIPPLRPASVRRRCQIVRSRSSVGGARLLTSRHFVDSAREDARPTGAHSLAPSSTMRPRTV